jgi:hypothetical protein
MNSREVVLQLFVYEYGGSSVHCKLHQTTWFLRGTRSIVGRDTALQSGRSSVRSFIYLILLAAL